MLDKFFGLFSHDVAIDLGPACALAASRKLRILPFREPNAAVGRAGLGGLYA